MNPSPTPGHPPSRSTPSQGDPACTVVYLSEVFFPHQTRQNPQTRTHSEADWWSGSCGSTGDDAPTAPGGAR